MSTVAIIPVAQMASANAALQAAGWGPNNFGVAAYGNGNPTHGCLHAYGPAALRAAIRALPGVIVDETGGDPATRLSALLSANGAQWGDRAPSLPSSGNALANTLYRFGDGLWWCIQTFSRTTFNLPPSNYPALIRRARRPGEILPWVQPIDQFDAYFTVNRFDGQPDRVTHNGRLWRSTVPSVPNVWQPGVGAEWADEGPA